MVMPLVGIPLGWTALSFHGSTVFSFRIWSVLLMEGILQQKVQISKKWMPKNWSSEQSLVIFFRSVNKNPPIVDDLLLEDNCFPLTCSSSRGSRVLNVCGRRFLSPNYIRSEVVGILMAPRGIHRRRYLKSSKICCFCATSSSDDCSQTLPKRERQDGWSVEHEYELIWTNK